MPTPLSSCFKTLLRSRNASKIPTRRGEFPAGQQRRRNHSFAPWRVPRAGRAQKRLGLLVLYSRRCVWRFFQPRPLKPRSANPRALTAALQVQPQRKRQIMAFLPSVDFAIACRPVFNGRCGPLSQLVALCCFACRERSATGRSACRCGFMATVEWLLDAGQR